MNSMRDLWDSVLKRLSGELSDITIKTWFDEVTVVTMEDSAFVLHCSNTFKKSTIEARFLPHIKAALRDLFSTDLEVKILDDQQLAAYHGGDNEADDGSQNNFHVNDSLSFAP